MQTYMQLLNELQVVLNRDLQLGLKDYELHYTLYPEQRCYQRHVDQFAQKKTRRVSFILYLNDNWKEAEVGLLKLYNKTGKQELASVLPAANSLLCFMSDLPHEVTTTQRQRLSITGWFKGY